jgi:hypothetical protein
MIAKVLPFQPDESDVVPVYTSDNTMNINNINWFYFSPSSGGNANNTKLIFNSGTIYPALGRLVPSNPSASLESLSKEILTVYPNPTCGMLMIRVSQPTNAVVSAANGTVIATLKLEGETVLDATHFTTGVYYLRTTEGQTMKFIKQ